MSGFKMGEKTKSKENSLFQIGVLTTISGVIGKSFLAVNPALFFIVGGGMCAYEICTKSNKYKKLFTNLGLLNKDGDIPKLVKRSKTKFGYQLAFTLPVGLGSEDFNKHKLRIEQYLNNEIKIQYASKNLLINVYEKQLEDFYEYEITKLKNPLELLLGYSLGAN